MPFNPQELPDLATLAPRAGTHRKETARDILNTLKRGFRGEAGPVDYEFGLNKAKLQTKYRDALIEALIKYDGGYELGVETPMLGGNLEFSMKGNGDTDDRRYGLQFKRRF